MQKSIAVVAPVFNEEECILEFIKQVTKIFDQNPQYLWRLILIENGSSDGSWDLMKNAQQIRKDVDVIRDLAVHDLALFDYFIPNKLNSVSAATATHLPSVIPSTASINLNYEKNL